LFRVSKPGYSGYSTTGWPSKFELEREFSTADVQRIADLQGDEQVTELRELLAGDFDTSRELYELVFIQENKFRQALRALITDPDVGVEAGKFLAFIGVPKDVRLFLKHAPPIKEPFDDSWTYGVVCALLEPTSKEEWNFLRSCALNEFDNLWCDREAIRTLKLIASPHSREILTEVKRSNEDRADYVTKAIEYIDANPSPIADADLMAAGEKVAKAIRIGNWRGNRKPRFNQKGDKALVECEFISGRDVLMYTATFHKVDGVWKLRGVRATMQKLLACDPEHQPDEE